MNDKNLIFLISQPRAGSTLLQRILGGHTRIYTISEPWVMLHPIYALRAAGYQAEYNADLAYQGLRQFLKEIQNGEVEYIEGVRRMYLYLYEKALAVSGKRLFLDKTPRYYLILEELYGVFPNAHFIILLRNPMAVLCSILNSRLKSEWLQLEQFNKDLFTAPDLIVSGIDHLGQKAIVVRYEEMVQNPVIELERICGELGIAFDPEIVDYGMKNRLKRWELGDEEEIYRHTRPISKNADNWIKSLNDPQIWRVADDYLRQLGPSTIQKLGYSFQELNDLVEHNRPANYLWATLPPGWLYKKPYENRKNWEHGLVRLSNSVRSRGIFKTTTKALRKGIDALSVN